MSEGLYDREWVESHSVGFDWFEHYILGNEGRRCEDPGMGRPHLRRSARQIKALARYWASHAVSIGHCAGGGLIRAAYSSEPRVSRSVCSPCRASAKPGAGQINFMDLGLFGIDDIYPLPRSECQPDMNSVYHGWAMLTSPLTSSRRPSFPRPS